MTNKKELIKAFEDADLGQYLPALTPLMRTAIRAVPERVEDEDEIPIGASKLGGHPDLPEGAAWPVVDDVLLEFVGQFRMEEVAPLDETGLLPKEGWLYFFFDGMLTDYGENGTRDRCKVIYFAGDRQALRRVQVPDHEHGIYFSLYSPCQVRWETTVNLPPYEELYDFNGMTVTPLLDPVDFENSDDCWAYNAVRRKFWDPGTQFLGNVVNIQGGEEKHHAVQKRFPGRYPYVDYDYENRDELEQKMKDLILLFTADSAQEAGMSWGDSGLVYYWIDKADLLAGNWDAVWAILTSC